MAEAKDEWVVREGRDWMGLRKVDPQGRLWMVTGGTLAAVGDIVRFPRLRRLVDPQKADGEPSLSPFGAEIVVDTLTRVVLLPESGRPFNPLRRTLGLLRTLEAAGLEDQAEIVRRWLGPGVGIRRAKPRAA